MAKVYKMYRVTKWQCPICDSKQILYRRESKTHWCRRCGSEFKLTKVKAPKPKKR